MSGRDDAARPLMGQRPEHKHRTHNMLAEGALVVAIARPLVPPLGGLRVGGLHINRPRRFAVGGIPGHVKVDGFTGINGKTRYVPTVGCMHCLLYTSDA